MCLVYRRFYLLIFLYNRDNMGKLVFFYGGGFIELEKLDFLFKVLFIGSNEIK